MKIIKKKILDLGGTELTEDFESVLINNFNFSNYLSENDLNLPKNVLFFIEKYGFNQFNENVIFKSIDNLSFSIDLKHGEINFIYGWGKEEYSLQEIRNTFIDQIPEKYFVFAEGNPGDQLCINMDNQKIYYWFHESPENQELYLISESFEEFINELSINETSINDDNDIEEEWFSDDF